MSPVGSNRVYYIIESPTLGTLRELEFEYDGSPKPKYSTTGSRADSDKAMQYPTLDKAKLTRDMIVSAKARGYKSLNILRAPDFHTLCDECGNWIEYRFGNPIGHDEQNCPVFRKWLKDRTG